MSSNRQIGASEEGGKEAGEKGGKPLSSAHPTPPPLSSSLLENDGNNTEKAEAVKPRMKTMMNC